MGLGWGCCDEKIIENVNNLGSLELVLNNPLQAQGELIKEKGGTEQTEGKDHIKEIEALPLHPQQFPIRGVDRDVPEGGFNVQFRYKAALTEILKYGDCIIYFNVLERKIFRGDVGINASEAVFGVG